MRTGRCGAATLETADRVWVRGGGGRTSGHLRVITDEEELAGMEAEWTGLLRRSAADTLCLSWPWIWTWWQVYGRPGGLSVFAVRDPEGRLVGVAPLCRRPVSARGVLFGTELAFLGAGEAVSDYLDFIVAPEDEAAIRVRLLDAVLEFPGWDVLHLDGILASSPLVECFAPHLRRRRMPVEVRAGDLCPYLPLPEGAIRAAEVVGRGMGADIRRKTRALEREGKVGFVVVRNPEALPAWLDVFDRLNRARLAAKDIRGGCLLESFAAFHRAIAETLLPRGQLRLCFLTLNDEPVAALSLFAYGRQYAYYQAGLDGRWARFSPGTVLFSRAIDEALREGMQEFDFLRGSEPYKTRWTRCARHLVRLTAYRRTPGGLMARASRAACDTLRRLRRSTAPSPGDQSSIVTVHPS